MADLRGPVALALLAGFLGVLATGWAVRRLAGPVFAHELTVLARRGTQPRLRAGLAAVLLGVLLFTYAGEYGWDAVAGPTPQADPRSSRFAERFAVTVLAVQLLAVVVLTPAVVGSAITEERDRGTLDLLRTTELTDREVVAGKLLARLAVVAGVVAAGLPVLALTLLFGGVDPRRLLVVYAVTAGTAFGLGAASFYLGTVRDSLRAVLAAVYGGVTLLTVGGACLWQVPGVGGLSPASLLIVMQAMDNPNFRWGLLGTYGWAGYAVFGLLYVGGGLVLAWASVGRVRTAAVRRTDDAAAVRLGMRRFYANPLGDDADPLVWQETEFGGRRFGGGEFRFACGAFVLFVFGAGLFVGVVRAVEQGEWIAGAAARAVGPFLTAAAVLVPLALGQRVAGAVVRERERQTLDALLMLPGDRRQVLRAKAVATLLWAGWGLGLVATALVLAVLVGGFGPVEGLLAGLHLVGATALAVGFAGWQSVRQRTGARATVLFLVGLLLVTVLPLVLTPLARQVGDTAGLVLLQLSPPAAVWLRWPSVWAVLPPLGYAAAGWLLWRAAEHRIEAGEPGA